MADSFSRWLAPKSLLRSAVNSVRVEKESREGRNVECEKFVALCVVLKSET